MTDAPAAPPDAGQVQLHDHVIPNLEAGTYLLTVSHTLDGAGATIPDATQRFTVQGPRFVLDPTEIHAVYPPANSSGRFGETLGHVVLDHHVLPWERRLKGQEKTVPWLALLLFDESELIAGQQPSPTMTTTMTVDDLLEADPQVLGPSLEGVSDAERMMTCQTIQLPGDVFRAVVPRPDELGYLAHTRQVSTDDQESRTASEDGWFAVVVGNRFPNARAGQDGGTRNIAHLVSLEGFEEYLAAGARLPRMTAPGDPAQDKQVRLVSLMSWSFTCLPDLGESFRGLVHDLVARDAEDTARFLLKRPSSVPTDRPAPTLSAEQAAQVAPAQARLGRGYVPLAYHTASGEDTFAWYRGPLAPVVTAPIQKSGPFPVAAAAMIYDQDTGVFDLSLAAAWQIGRSLALADRGFASRLLRFRRESHRLIDLLLARLQSVHLDTPDDLKSLLGDNLIDQKFTELLQADLAAQVQAAGDSSPPAAPSTPAAAPAQTDAPATPVDALKQFLARDDVQATLAQEVHDDLDPVAQWLARLGLLYDLPFTYLVPDERMLPTESIRFFYLDQNWLDALVDGALSVGVQTSRDTFYQDVMKDVIRDAVQTVTTTLRARLTGVASGPPAGGAEAMSGLLIRSAVVSGWPGLTVRAVRADGQPLKLLRMDLLAPSVLFCIFLDVPDRVEISEPQQGLRFGADDGTIPLRRLSGQVGQESGQQFRVVDDQATYMRPGAERVIALTPSSGAPGGLVGALASQLGVDALGSADFALQMIRTPEQLVFQR